MAKSKMPFGVVDSSGLTDADWVEINKLKRAYEIGGEKALSKAINALAADEVRYIRIMGACFPHMIRELSRDKMAAMGVTQDDLREMLQKIENPSLKKH